MVEEDVSVTMIDDLSQVADPQSETRKLSEYSATNMPLSANEIEQDEARDTRHMGWAPRNTENIRDLKPLPEHPSQPE